MRGGGGGQPHTQQAPQPAAMRWYGKLYSKSLLL